MSSYKVKYNFKWALAPMCQGDYGTAEDECCSAVKPILTQWGLVPSFTTSDLGEVGKRELYREQGTGERRLLHKENFSTYKRRIPTALQGLCSGVAKLEEFTLHVLPKYG